MKSGSEISDVAGDLSGHRKRLRERFRKAGIPGLHEHEILELLLTYAIPRRDVKPLAKKLLKYFGSVNMVMEAQENELMAVDGIGDSASILISFIRELNSYCLEQPLKKNRIHVRNQNFIDFMRSKLGRRKKEMMMVMFVNGNGFLIDTMCVAGTIDQTCVYAREVIESAILCHASGIILAHNHPGGSILPSSEDVKMTDELLRSLRVINLRLLDHYIVTHDRVVSIMHYLP